MAKSGSLSDMIAEQLGQPEPKKKANSRVRKDAVVQLSLPGEAAPATSTGEIEKVTVYLPKAAYRFVKQVALELEKRPHDLLIQGIELMLAQHGKSMKDFTGKQR